MDKVAEKALDLGLDISEEASCMEYSAPPKCPSKLRRNSLLFRPVVGGGAYRIQPSMAGMCVVVLSFVPS